MESQASDAKSNKTELMMEEMSKKLQEVLDAKEEAQKKTSHFLAANSPLVIAVWAAVIGIFAQLISTYYTESQKMQYFLIQNAMQDVNKKQAIRNLTFLKESGLIGKSYVGNINQIVSNSSTAPVFPGAAIRDEIVTISQVKQILKDAGFYKGTVDDRDDREFRRAVAAFQMSKGAIPDGLVGGCTLRDLWWTTEEFRQYESAKDTEKRKGCN